MSTLNSQLSTLIAIPCLLTGGTEMQTLRLVEALVEEGHHCVTVCYFEYDFKIVQMYEKAGSRVICLSAYGDRPSGTRATYAFLKRGLSRVLKEYRPKVALVQYMAPGAMPVIILRRLGMKNIIAMLHTDADIYRSLRLVRFLQRHVTRLFTCVTETAERNFFGSSHVVGSRVQGFKGSRVQGSRVQGSRVQGSSFRFQVSGFRLHDHCTLPNCLPQGYQFQVPGFKFQFSTKFSTINYQLSIGFVARLEEIKGADIVIPAFAKVLESQPDTNLLIVGDGKLRGKMMEQQRQMQIPDDRIEWAGMVDYRQLTDYYKHMTLVWVPSRSEGFGLSAIEALGQGCPVVAANVGGLKEIVHDGEDGLHFEPQNIDDLASKTLQLLSDPQLLQTMSAQAITTAQQYSFDTYKERVRKIIDN